MSGKFLYLYCFIFAGLIKVLCQIHVGDKIPMVKKNERIGKNKNKNKKLQALTYLIRFFF